MISLHARWRKILSYYKPYRRLFLMDMGCAFAASLILLSIPLCIRAITKNLDTSPSLSYIGWIGALLVLLIALYAACHFFIDYQGHLMGARMEKDMRNELFSHYQKLSFKFFDDHRTGQLMTRISHDLKKGAYARLYNAGSSLG
jgi:ATP-binding cassette subfamily B protein